MDGEVYSWDEQISAETRLVWANKVASFIVGVPLLSSLTATELREIGAVMSSEEYEDELIVKEGEAGDSMYIIKSGSVAVELSGTGVVATMGARRFFGEQVLVQRGGVRTASVRANGLARVLCLKRATAEAMMEKHPSIGKAFVSVDIAREAGGAGSGGGDTDGAKHKVIIGGDGAPIDMVQLPLWFEAIG